MRFAIALALALIAATPAAAQEAVLRQLTTDRPDKTESPITVDRGHVQIELDLATWTRDRTGGVVTESWAVAPINLKYGVDRLTDIQLIVAPYVGQRVRDDTTGARRTIGGVGDTTIRVKRNLWGDDAGDGQGTTAFALMPFVTLPTARAGLGSGYVEGGVIAPFALVLSERFSLGAMTEVDVVRRSDDRGYTASFVNSASLGIGLGERLGMYVELFTEKAAERGAAWVVTGDVGFTLAVGENAQFDTGVNLGLSDAADDVNLFVGYSHRF